MNYELKKLQNKKICILGLGIENYALVKFLLEKKIDCEIAICDARNKEKLGEKYKELAKYKNIKWQLGGNYNKKLYNFDILFRSPGWPIFCPGIKKFLQATSYKLQANLSSPMKIFFELCLTKNIIGITGTKGKGTTASLIYEILKSSFAKATADKTAGKKVYLGGNIGIAPFEFMGKIKKNDWVVLELSSFHLEDMEVSPRIAVITNFSSEHLAPADPNNPNYHKSLDAYLEAKLNIVKWQNKSDFFVVNSKIKNQNVKLQFKIKKLRGKKIFFTKSELPSKLIGEHNKENIAAAVAVAKVVGIKDSVIAKAVKNFKGLPHRLEFVKNIKGVKYYNDTFATTAESTITALKSFKEPIVLIAGGAEKNSGFKEFVREAKKRTKFIVLLNGDATPRIKKELLKINYPKNKTKLVYSMKEAVKIARGVSRAGDIILLSPACASFGMFKNYKERGKLFKEEVKKQFPSLRRRG
jgi:UDP-N-acetylmuramoylalanine--D-glutamate ligase